MFYLVTYENNYADEFDVQGFAVMSQEELDQWEEEVGKMTFPDEYNFGSNEYVLHESKEQFSNCIEVRDITEQEAKVLSDLDMDTFGLININYLSGM